MLLLTQNGGMTERKRSLSSKCHAVLVMFESPHMEILFILNVHVEGYVQSYCVHYNLTHEHKGTRWGGGGSYVEDHRLQILVSEAKIE